MVARRITVEVAVILSDSDVERYDAEAATQIYFLVGVVEFARVEVAGVADAVTEVADFAAVAEVAIDLKSVVRRQPPRYRRRSRLDS